MTPARARAQVLVVDDDPLMREVMRRILTAEGHVVVLAADAAEARRLIREQSFEVALCDVHLPGESGLSLGAHLAAEYPGTATLMVTGVDDAATAEATVAFGAVGYLLKPVRQTELVACVEGALRQLDRATTARRERDALERRLEEQTVELRDALEQLGDEAHGRDVSGARTMAGLARAIEYRSRETGDHIARVGLLSEVIAENMGLGAHEAQNIRIASAMHDVGKVAVADEILLKPGPLTPEERRHMERHTDIGHEVLRATDGDLMQLAAGIAWCHHERFDGGGYPRGLEGDQIPLPGRIVAVADMFDALTQDRVYRAALPVEEAVEVMEEVRGSQLDPAALDPLLESLDAAVAIAQRGSPSASNGAARELRL